MPSLFEQYDIVEKSGLFDAVYYTASNPELRHANIDPILHYLEQGARDGLNPSSKFDTAFYLEQCKKLGDLPENPLLHFVIHGAGRGLKIHRDELSAAPPAAVSPLDRVALDFVRIVPRNDGRAGLNGAGWLIASEPIAEIAVELLGEALGYATYGISRPDVAAQHPSLPNADQSGFAFSIEPLPQALQGSVELSLAVRLSSGRALRHPFSIELRAESAAQTGPWRGRGLNSSSLPPMRLQTDEVSVDQEGVLTVDGWVVSLAPVGAVEISIDDQPLGLAEFGKRRDDVAEVYRDYLNPAFSGFRFVADLRPFGEGKRTLKVQASAKGGIKREVLVPLLLAAPAKPRPPIDQAAVRVECDDFRLTGDGRLSVDGWAVCAAGIEAIKILLDGIEVGAAALGLDRPDVGNIFPSIPAARQAGFAFRGIVAKAIEGEHLLSIRVRTPEGDAGDLQLPVAAIVIAPEAAEPGGAPAGQGDLRIAIDAPGIVNGAATFSIRSSLSINGWALAASGVASVDIAIDGKHVSAAYYGIRRDDVAAAFPNYEGALLSGYATLIPNRALPKGRHMVCVTLKDKKGKVATQEFSIEVEEMAEEAGPWSLRRKIPQSEVDLQLRLLRAVDWHPQFCLLLLTGSSDPQIEAARRSLASLEDQVYGDWRLMIAPLDEETDIARLERDLPRGFDDLAARVSFVRASSAKQSLDQLVHRSSPGEMPCLFGIVSAGDELGIDALLELAAWSALNRNSDFIYCDERRINPGTGKPDAFFKPDWSPDLLLSTNYIGRFWCTTLKLLGRTGITLGELQARGEYDLVLRCTELAVSIGHVPLLLSQRSSLGAERAASERAALKAAIKRRGIKGQVKDGCVPGIYQLKRARRVKGLVSIIIPTCAARGLVKICIETLRANTAYRNFEIVCIENIPAHERAWQEWLYANADKVLTTSEPFNWSRFNNLAAAEASGEYLVFLNDDIEIISPDWLDVLLSHVQRPEVGIVGPLLLYPDRTIQHAGVFLTHMGIARHAFRCAPEDDPGYFGLALTDRNVIGVTGACLMTRRDTFDLLHGFDETHTVINNDLDYCLRAWEAGLLNVFTAQAKLIHHELASRSEIAEDYDSAGFDTRWRNVFLRGDPYFHPSLSKDSDDYSANREPLRVVCAGHPVLAPERVRRLLIVKLDHIGDCVTAIPAVNRLRKLFPDARVSIMASRASKSVWSLVPDIDEIIEFDFFHARSILGSVELTEQDLLALRARLEPYRFDLAVDLRKSPDTRHLLQYTGARYFAGFGHQANFPWLDVAVEWEGDPKFQSKHAHVSEDLLRLCQALALACDTDRSVLPSPPVPSPLPADLASVLYKRRVVVIHPAAGTPTRQWPPALFAQLIDLLLEDYDVNIALIGSPDEQEIAEFIIDAVRRKDRVTSLLGKLKLHQVAEFLPTCALFIGNNSGPSHLAAALGVPTVAVHSGTIASEEWGPYGPTGVAIRRDMACAPCYLAKPEDCHRQLACLSRLGPGEVLQVCRRFLALDAGGPPKSRGKRGKGSSSAGLRAEA